MNFPCFGYISAPNFTESREWVCILMNISEKDWDGYKSWGTYVRSNWWGMYHQCLHGCALYMHVYRLLNYSDKLQR